MPGPILALLLVLQQPAQLTLPFRRQEDIQGFGAPDAFSRSGNPGQETGVLAFFLFVQRADGGGVGVG